jgi:hypothetical protein
MDKLEIGINSAHIEKAKNSKDSEFNDVAAHAEHLKKVSREQSAKIELL